MSVLPISVRLAMEPLSAELQIAAMEFAEAMEAYGAVNVEHAEAGYHSSLGDFQDPTKPQYELSQRLRHLGMDYGRKQQHYASLRAQWEDQYLSLRGVSPGWARRRCSQLTGPIFAEWATVDTTTLTAIRGEMWAAWTRLLNARLDDDVTFAAFGRAAEDPDSEWHDEAVKWLDLTGPNASWHLTELREVCDRWIEAYMAENDAPVAWAQRRCRYELDKLAKEHL